MKIIFLHKDSQGYPTEWDIVFVADGVYRWKATSWPERKVNLVVGVKCSK